MSHSTLLRIGIAGLLVVLLGFGVSSVRSDTTFIAGTPPTIAQVPLYMRDAVPPLNMLVMGKDHKIYYEAYNDASDLDGDGILDVGYRGWELKNPAPTDGSSRYKIDYYGYFNSYVCYSWQTNRFVPQSATTNKQCTGRWSGDFLNYLTMSRMDALRRVLYGGWRHVDTNTETVLQGAYFPQDAHSWGKEYQSVARDGYDIRNYAPLPLPGANKYHLFAVTTVTDTGAAFPNYTAPMFRVMQNSDFRVWNWLSIEGPVAGNNCFNSSNSRVACISGSSTWQLVPASALQGLQLTTWRRTIGSGSPGDLAGMNTLFTGNAIAANQCGTGTVTQINKTATNNPFTGNGCGHDNYLSRIQGQIVVPVDGTYRFAVDGDDAVDVFINGTHVVGWYGGHANDRSDGGLNNHSGTITLAAGTHSVEFRHQEAGGDDNWGLFWEDTSSAGSRQDYAVRVLACPDGATNAALRDGICKAYGNAANPIYKPTGILHDYGETRKMFFGLITGSQANNIEGGVLRSNIEDFNREIDPDNGRFRTDVEGVVRSIDRLRMIGGGYNSSVTDNLNSDTNWNWANTAHGVGGNCVSQGGRVINNGECRMWGNPIAEMLFEGLRYFAGAAAPTARFSSGGSTEGQSEDTRLGLPAPAWRNPYADTVVNGDVTHPAYPTCAKPHQTIVSDINPSYDGDLPGSAFNDTGNDTALPGLDVESEGQEIWTAEFGEARSVFIGEVDGQATDGAPTAKSASSFGNIRGLAPEEPTKQGTYYSASVARYGRNIDINAADDEQNVVTYSIALASPLPRIEFPVGGQTVTLLPFAKTVSGTFGGATRKPTNTIVDFYVESFANFPAQIDAGEQDATVNEGRPYAVFRINYEDVEQGNDHDMDAIVRYEILSNSDNTVTINLTSEYAYGSANQAMGYVISGTSNDGIYLEVRDRSNGGSPAENAAGNAEYTYELNTPAGIWAGGCVGATSTAPCNQGLGFNASRTFTPGTVAGGTQLNDPLWYAAKYGSPTPTAWDQNNDGDPDNYFLVTNPLNLRAQLSRAFDDISMSSPPAGSQALNGARVGSSSFTLTPSFLRDREGNDWTGNLSATAVNQDGTLATMELWNAQAGLPAHSARNIRTAIQAGVSSAITVREFLGNNDNLGVDNVTRFGRLGITQDLSTLPNAYEATYSPAAIVDYLRGDQSREADRPGVGNTLRARSSVLGDIINSEPIIASPRSDFGYGSYAGAMFSGYSGDSGYLVQKQSRDTVVYVGANDGMLHAFNGNTTPCAPDSPVACAGTGAGAEMFAFIPHEALRRLGQLALPDALYNHRYYVDGQVTVTDAKDGGVWKTVLVGAMGGGGRSVFALDVSNPGSFGNGDVLWELNATIDNDIGNVYGRPLLLPLENDRWGVLFGNGYGGHTSDPSLYIVDAFTGQPIAKLTADDGHQAGTSTDPLTDWICGVTGLLCARTNHPFNGLGQITAIDRDGNGKADTVYGGDLQGNLWKFDLSNASETLWNVAFGGEPLVTALASNGQRQPVTGGIRVSAGPGDGVMVYFGTGRYFVEGDNDIAEEPDVQSLYGVFDSGTAIAIANASEKETALQRQWIQLHATNMIDTDGNGTPDTNVTTRNISRNRVSYYGGNAKRGWYLDLVVDNEAGNATGSDLDPVGERFIATPRIQSGRVFFTTFSPTGDSCDPGGTNIVYALDLLSGAGALSHVRTLGSESAACEGANCGAVQIENAGAPITSTSVAAINPTKYITEPTCTPGVDCPSFEECQVVIYPGAFVLPRPCGRQSWRQLK
ncbi:hypothetical protein FQY83_11520 [Luteimonas marina]|uniref:PA14 domain-containing protein n=1 Tax=Luteimonas marina TaxID=488485 RepID=A0A5C5U345_9GAMM|nr:PilC/PilY family type IV pilus protein [Luteimonas marina]TWT20347.1 hypothetical protein FQY83_11520 [Luteimonas marina]